MDKPEPKKNWEILRDNRKFLDKYLDMMSMSQDERGNLTSLVVEFYNQMSQEDLIWWMLLMGELVALFNNEEMFDVNILTGLATWEVK